MSDWSKPTLTSLYTAFITEVGGRLDDAAKMNRTGGGTVPSVVTLTNPPVGTVKFNAASGIWESNTGTGATASVPVWEPLAASYGITVAKANQWTTTRTVTLTGDATATATNIDGSANVSIATTLATVNANTGSVGSASAVPVLNLDAKGRVLSASTAALGSMATQAANAVSITGGAVSGTALTLVQSTTSAPTAEGRVEWDTDDDTIVVGNGAGALTFAPLIPTNPVTMQKHTFGANCTWNGNVVPVLYGGTGGADAVTARTNLGMGSMATQTASAVAITGGAISATAITLVQSTTAAPTAEGVIEWDTNDDLLAVGASGSTKLFAPLSPTAQVTATNYSFSTGCVWNGGVISVTYGGTGAATLTGVAYGNGTGAFTAASAAQIVAAISTTAVANATNSVNVSQTTDPAASTYRLLLGNATNASGVVYNKSGLYWNDVGSIIQGANISGNAATASAVAWANVSGKPTNLSTIATNDLGNYGGWVVSGGALGTPASGTLTNCTFPTLNQNTTGTASNITAYTINQSVGTGNSPSFVDVTITSDERLKTNWRGFDSDVLHRLATIKRGIYDRVDIKRTQVGASANDFQKVVAEGVTEDENGFLQISQSATLALLSELTALVLAQGQRIAELERRV
jgi:hypothetical protein